MMPCPDDDPIDVLRRTLCDLPDDTVRDSVGHLVNGIITGFVAELAANVDSIVADATEAILEHLATADEPAEEPEPANLHLVTTPPAPPSAKRHQDSNRRACEICGRVGTRRFTETDTGWRCSPSATACPGNKAAATSLRESRNEPAVKPIQPNVPPPPPDPEPIETTDTQTARISAIAEIRRSITPTAHCGDCSRTWTLTGIPLEVAVEQHEQRTSHIVKVTAS